MAQLFGTFRIGNDPELRYLPDGTAVTNLSLASNYGKRDAQTNRRQTQWVDAVLWGKHAEAVTQYLVKGHEVTVTIDEPHNEEFQRHGGGVGYKLTGRISSLQLIGGQPQTGQQQQSAAPQQQQRQAAPQGRQAAPAPQPAPDFDQFDDDIPF